LNPTAWLCHSSPATHLLPAAFASQLRRLLEQERYAAAVAYRKKKDHFIFTIESSGVLPPQELLAQALDILNEKARSVMEKL
jgi:DNA-directed RNA polymerase I and III subunit RPAC1